MKKIPTLFERKFEGHKIVGIIDKITPGCEIPFICGAATVKIDGSCCAIIDGGFYKRYDARVGKRNPPEGAIPCSDPDPVTGHWPHWVKVDPGDPADKWFYEAYTNAMNRYGSLPDGTYEAVGLHFQGNPYGFSIDMLERHGREMVCVERTFEGVKRYLTENEIEGLVFWFDDEPVCKIKRSDFGLPWNDKGGKKR